MTSADKGTSISLDGQKYIDPANGIAGVPSSSHGSYGYVFVQVAGIDDRGATFVGKTPIPDPLPVPVSSGTVVIYSMRRTDTGAVGGYAHWVNTTGNDAGAPAPIGVVGNSVIVTTF